MNEISVSNTEAPGSTRVDAVEEDSRQTRLVAVALTRFARAQPSAAYEAKVFDSFH